MSVVLRMTRCARAGAFARPEIENRIANVIVRVGAAILNKVLPTSLHLREGVFKLID